MSEGADALLYAFFIDVHDQVKPELLRYMVPERDHVPELPGGINMQQRERWLARVEGFQGKMQHHGRILADGVKHDRVVELGGHFPNDVDAFGFQLFEMGEVICGHVHPLPWRAK